MIFFSCQNSNSLVRHQLQLFSSSYPFTYISTSTFFNFERMTMSLFKYHCALREDGTLVRTYGEFSEDLFKQIFDTIGNEPAVFPFRFIFVAINNSSDITAQLFALRNIKRYKVIIRENFIILIKRKKKFSNTLHIAPDGEFILVIHKTLKQNVAYMREHTACT